MTKRSHAPDPPRGLGASLALLLALAAVGCNPNNNVGDRSDTGLPDVGPDVPEEVGDDADAGDADTGADADTSPDVVEDTTPREPSEPTLVVVSLAPARGVYPLGVVVTPTAVVYDQYGDPMPSAPVNWTLDPPNAGSPQGAGFKLEREGELTFRGCTPLDETGALNECGWRRIQVDSGSPQLEIFTPEPGAELLAEEHPMIHVTGRATDTNGRVRVFVNGERSVLDAEGNFAVDVRPTYGVNHIEVVASDGLNSRATVRGVDVMWAPYYYPIGTDRETGTIAGSYPHALLLRLNQRYLDADEPVTIDPEELILVARDLSGLLEFIISEVDLSAFVPEVITESDSLQLRIAGATLGRPEVDIRVTREGIEIFVSMREIAIETDGQIILTDDPISLDGTVGLVVSAFIDMVIHKRSPEAPLVVEARSVQLALEDATGDFERAEISALIELAEGLLFDVLEDLALQAVEDAFLADFPALIDDLLGSIEESLTGFVLPLDLGLGGDIVDLQVDALLDSIIPQARSGLMIDFGLDVGTTATPAYPDSRGAAMNQPFDRPAALFLSSRIQIAVRVPLLNGILHSLWNSGLLTIDAGELIPPELSFVIEGAQLTGLLPPHLTATRPDTIGYQFVLTIGQLEMELWRQERRDRVGINAVVAANINVVDNTLIVEIAPEPDVDMWMIEQLGPQPVFDDVNALESLFIGAIWPMLTEQIEGGLAIELPAIELAAIGEFAPRLSDLTLDLVLDNPIEIREGYFVLDGAFEGVADLSE